MQERKCNDWHEEQLFQQPACEVTGMSENESYSYDAVPYESSAFTASNPDRLAVIGRLFGIQTPPVETSRVLELACGDGSNIVPLAYALPQARFVGADLSHSALSKGWELISRMGIRNIELKQLDLRKFPSDLGKFDYIICHGAYSWVPDDVKASILQICRSHLNESGVAYISYNCYPGWHQREIARQLMLFHSEPHGNPKLFVHQARAILDYLPQLVPQTQSLYRSILQTEQQTIKGLASWHL